LAKLRYSSPVILFVTESKYAYTDKKQANDTKIALLSQKAWPNASIRLVTKKQSQRAQTYSVS